MAAPTQRDLFLAGRREAVSLPTRFDRAIIDTDGSDVNVVLNAAATMGEEVAAYHQQAQNDRRLATAAGEALDRLVWDLYRIRRPGEAPAVVTLELSRASGGTGFSIEAQSAFGTVTGQTFLTSVPAAFASGDNGPIYVFATASNAGLAGNVEEGSITRVQGTYPDTTLAVTNPQRAAGGTDALDDETFRDLARQFFVTARRGTKSAIEFGALQVPQVAQATADEIFDPGQALPVYRVTLIVADAQGQSNTALVGEAVRELDEYRALGVPVLGVPATPQYVNIRVVGVSFTAGTNTAQALADARATLLAITNALAPGAKLYRSALLGGLAGVASLVVPDGALVEPAGDLVPTTGTVIRTSFDRVEVIT